MSETTMHSVGSSPGITHSGEEPMLREDTVQEVLAGWRGARALRPSRGSWP
jgi:hypothetical protein